MYKIANQVIDIYDDVHCTYMRKVAEKMPTAYVMTPDEHAKLADDDFALTVITKTGSKLNKFPLNTPGQTLLSQEYFTETFPKLGEQAAIIAATHIKKACQTYSLSVDPKVEAVASLAGNSKIASTVYHEGTEKAIGETHTKKASSTASLEPFADAERIAASYTHAQYVMATPAHVKIAGEYFEKKSSAMPLEIRHKYAAAIQTRAKELGMQPVGGTVAKYASDSFSGNLEGHLLERRMLLDHKPDLQGELSKLASGQKQFTPQQFAQLLHGFDKKAGLDRHYGGFLTNPYEATFAQSPDQNAHVRWMDKKGSRTLTDEEIRRVVNDRHTKIAEYFGNSVADGLKKDPISVFESLPMDAKEVIANIHDGAL